MGEGSGDAYPHGASEGGRASEGAILIASVSIENFRGVREGGVEGLAPISILVGPNNTGKSTVLEAIAATGYGQRLDEVVTLLLRRGGPPLDALGGDQGGGSGGGLPTILCDEPHHAG
jgi:hypothetical protein